MVRSPRSVKGQQQKRVKNESIVEDKADSMGAKIEDDTQAKKEEIEAEPPEKKVKTSNSQDEAGDAKELKQRRSSYKRLGISEDEAEKLLKSEDANQGRRTRSRSRGGTTESPRAAKKATPAKKETPSKRGRKAKKAPAATAAEEEEEEAAAEEEEAADKAGEESAKGKGDAEGDSAAKEEDGEDEDDEEAPAGEDGEQEAGKDDASGEKAATDDGEDKTE